MSKFCFILSHSNNIIDFCRTDSDRFQLLKSVILEGNNLTDKFISISKEKLYQKVILLLKERLNREDDIDFGNRFDEKNIIVSVVFNNKTIRLKTSGVDNLIIFAINIYNNLGSKMIIKFSNYKNFKPPLLP